MKQRRRVVNFKVFSVESVFAGPARADVGTQAPGLIRHGSFPAVSLSGRQPLEPPPATTLEILENKLAI